VIVLNQIGEVGMKKGKCTKEVFKFLDDYFKEKFPKEVIEYFMSSAIKAANGENLEKYEIESLKFIDNYFFEDLGIHFFSKKGIKMIEKYELR